MNPTLWQRVQRVVHHCILHPMCAVHVSPRLRAWTATRFPAYDERDEGQIGQDPDDPLTRGWNLDWFIHHAIAHPLLVLCPWIGEPLHAWSGERL